MGARFNRKTLLYSLVRLEKTVSLLEAKWATFLDNHAKDFMKGVETGLVAGYAPIHRPKVVTFDEAMFCREVLVTAGRVPTRYPSKATLLAFKKLENIYTVVADLKDWIYFFLHRHLVEYIEFEKSENGQIQQPDGELETHEDRYNEAVQSFRDWPIERRIRTLRGAQVLHPDVRDVLHDKSKSKKFGMLLGHIAYAIDCAKAVLMILEPSKSMWQRDADTKTISKDGEHLSSVLEELRDESSQISDENIEGSVFSKWPISIGYIGCDGGALRLEDTGIQVYIPQGAIANDLVQELFIALENGDVGGELKITDGDEEFDDNGDGFLTVSPVVRFAPRYLRFDEPVMLTLPHCARRVPPSKFRMAYSYHKIGKRCKWRILSGHELQMVVKDDRVVAFVTRGGCYQVKVVGNDNGDDNVWKILGVGLYASPLKDFMSPDHVTLQLRVWNDTVADKKLVDLYQEKSKQFHLADSGRIKFQRKGRDLQAVVTSPRGWRVSQDTKVFGKKSLMALSVLGGCQAGFLYCRKSPSSPRSSTPRSDAFKLKIRQLKSGNVLNLSCSSIAAEELEEDRPYRPSPFRTRNRVVFSKSKPMAFGNDVMDALCRSLDKKRDMIVMVGGEVKCMDFRSLAKNLAFNVSINKYWRDPEPVTRNRYSWGSPASRKDLAATWGGWEASMRFSGKNVTYKGRPGTVPSPRSRRPMTARAHSSRGWTASKNYGRPQTSRSRSVADVTSSGRYGSHAYNISGINGEISKLSDFRKNDAIPNGGSRVSSAASGQSFLNGRGGSSSSRRSISFEFQYQRSNVKAYLEKNPREEEQLTNGKTVKKSAPNHKAGEFESFQLDDDDDATYEIDDTSSPRWRNPARRIINYYISEGILAGKDQLAIAEDMWQRMGDIGNTFAQKILYKSTVLKQEQASDVAGVIALEWMRVARKLDMDEEDIMALKTVAGQENWNSKKTAEVFLVEWIASMERNNERPALLDLLAAAGRIDEKMRKKLKEVL